MSKFIGIARGLGIVSTILIYTLLVHHVNTSNAPSSLGAVLALTPIFILILSYVWKTHSRSLSIIAFLTLSTICWLLWSIIKLHTGLVFWLLDVSLMLVLMTTFAQSLLPNRKPLCVHFAETINGGSLPIAHEIYARKVTIAWVIFFAVICITSTLLFFFAPLAIWSFFVNFLTLPLVALMFIGEFILRQCLLSDLPSGHLLDAVKAYLDKSSHLR